jgi:Na+/H+ antiporter NhaD/arsenite permease-like protein
VPLAAASLADIAKALGAFATAGGLVFAVIKFVLSRRDKRRKETDEAKLLDELAEQLKDVLGPTAGVVLPLLIGFSAGGPRGAIAVAQALAAGAAAKGVPAVHEQRSVSSVSDGP